MAASENNPDIDPPSPRAGCLSAGALQERLGEEIDRSERHGTALSCLLIRIENLEELAREHGHDLREQTLHYVAGALPRELRRFDRVGMPSERELLVVLPGADGPRGEIVARRVLERMGTIKVEMDGARRPLRVSVGLTSRREQDDAERLIGRARAAAVLSANGEDSEARPAVFAPAARRHGAPPAPGPRAAS